MTSPAEVVILSAEYSDISRRSHLTIGQLSVQAVTRAVQSAGIRMDEIDGLSNFPSPSRPGAGTLDGLDIVSPVYMAQALRIPTLRWVTSLTRGSYTASIAEATNALRAGACKYALVWRAMKNPPGQYGRVPPGPVGGDDAFTAPYGFNNEVVKASMIYTRYMDKYGTTRSDMAEFVVSNRAKAAANPKAVFYDVPLSRDEYMDARMIADPLSLFDCDMAIDGCAAIVMTLRENAGSGEHDPVGVAAALNLGIPPSRRNFYVLEEFQEAAKSVADRTLEACGMSEADLTHLEFYDGFVYFPWLWMEAFGMAKEGEAASLMTEADSGISGRRPLNTGGGSLGMGRIHGGAQVVEAVHQIQKIAGPRQIRSPGPTIITSGSPLSGCGSLVFVPLE